MFPAITFNKLDTPVSEFLTTTTPSLKLTLVNEHLHLLNLVGYLSSDEDAIIEDTADALVTLTPPTVKILEAEDGHTVRRSYDEGLLGACQQMGAPDDEKKKTLWIMDTMKLRPISLINNSGIEQTVLAHENSLNSIINPAAGKEYPLEYVAVGQKRPWDDSPSPSAATNKDQMEAALQSLLHYGPFHLELSKRQFVQLDDTACCLLNTSWELSPQLRYACGQLLAKSIIMNDKREAVMTLF
ncbi:hypothetical protein [Absidia glauca]|uniref:Uncharacterized protein n=1 Tax=Absidia glauca TaxID=4829 RepID=A0A163JSD2_ABSGL|nr:hypothetical protein [Absidia glauca]